MRYFSSLLLSCVAVSGACKSKSTSPAPTPTLPPTQQATTEARTPAKPIQFHGHGEKEGDGKLTLAALADQAVLLDGLGAYQYPITTSSDEARTYFDQGFRLIYAFNHDEAARSFARAAKIDPACAMCWWGAALVLGPNYNVPMLPDRFEMAWDALQRAVKAAPKTTAVEQALIAALAKRYPGPEPRDPAAQMPHSQAYATAMREVAGAYPDDVDVQTLFAESLMDLNPWKLWSLDGKPAEGTKEIVATLEKVLAAAPEHPGANHYYIHAIEASTTPDKGVPAAERLGKLMPGAGHLVHMPAHIFQRVGRYADAAESNRKAVDADLAYIKIAQPWGYYPMYLGHNYGFLAFAASMEGRSAETIEAARHAAAALPPEMLEMMPGMDFFTAAPLLAMVRFGKWEDLLAEPRPDAKYQVLTALWLHSHGMAAAATGRLEDAVADHQALVALTEEVSGDVLAGNNVARDVMAVGAMVLEARIAQERKDKKALDLWAKAVAAADKLAYSEPNDWFYPVRHYQGAALLAAEQYGKAAAVFREDLVRNPNNGWSLFGLAEALDGQKKKKEAKKVRARFQKAWANADIELTATAF